MLYHRRLNLLPTTISHYLDEIKTGFNLKISSDFSSTMGLGSSQPLPLRHWGADHLVEKANYSLELFNIAKEIIIKVQGKGSGADARQQYLAVLSLINCNL